MQPDLDHSATHPGVWLVRVFLVLLVATAAAHGSERGGDPGVRVPLSFDVIDELARAAAGSPYSQPGDAAPDPLRAATDDEWRSLGYTLDPADVWSDGVPRLDIKPILPGPLLNQNMIINIVDRDGVRRLDYDPACLNGANGELAEQVRRDISGFAGLAVGDNGDGKFLGAILASHFLFTARKARMASFSRPAVFDIGSGNGESFAVFRECWLVPPEQRDDRFIMYALMDSPVMTGAFSFHVEPGTSTVVDVHAVFHPRSGAAVPLKIGIAPLVSMFLFSETHKDFPDYRPEVHNADGLLVASGENDWQWIPLENPTRLTVTQFPGAMPKGFGLLQRDINFDHYQDLETAFENVSSVWVEPTSDWGPGRLELMEIPSTREVHPNIIAYWVSEKWGNGGAAGSGTRGDESGFSFDYRMYWTPGGMQMHSLGAVRDTRMERSAEDGTVTFHIDFDGADLNLLPADTGLTSVVEMSPELTLLDKKLVKNRVTGGWRLRIRVALPKSGVFGSLLTARNGPPPLWLTAHLKQGENLPEALTETWRYRILP